TTVNASRGDIDRAIDALLENALHYSPTNTTITITAGDNSIAVDDQGPGLTDDDIDKLFERFHRGSAGRAGVKGTGLGLAIARELARQWQAEVSISALPEGGTRASIDFASHAASSGGGA
ncbi:MAG: sensor histidine kinase, partial [Thermoleophilaceae bacterium]|nr:sensor histidine kinase [Thermoleophilaceae bacterium]